MLKQSVKSIIYKKQISTFALSSHAVCSELKTFPIRGTRFFSRHSEHHRKVRRIRTSGLSASAVFCVISVLAGCSLGYQFLPANTSLTGVVSSKVNSATTSRNFELIVNSMTGETLPGRPGNLTPDQEAKLREVWLAALQVFGVYKEPTVNGINEDGDVGQGLGSLSLNPEKKKKKRLGLFSRKYGKENDTESTVSSESSSAAASTFQDVAGAAEFEDKYGQTKEFKNTLASHSPEDLRAAYWSMVKHDHPDGLFLRFLRARKWDVEKALIMMVATMNWRQNEMHVDDDIMKKGEFGALEASRSSDKAAQKIGEDFMTQLRIGKSFLHGVDKEGRPMCMVRVRLHKQGEQGEESLERYTVYLIETARMLLAPPVDTAVRFPVNT